MASIRKRGNSYQVIVSMGYDANGTKITETDTFTPEPGMKKKELETALAGFAADFERKVKAGKNVKGERMTLAALAEMYMADMKPPVLARTTYSDYRYRISSRIIPALGHIKIGSFRKKDLTDYEKMLRETYKNPKTGKPLSDSSIQKDCALVSSVLSYAVAEGILDMNMLIYAGKVKKGQKSPKATAKKKIKYFTTEQLIRFIDALERPIEVVHQEHVTTVRGKQYQVQPYTQTFQLSNKWKLYFYIALFAGDRRGENISLTWMDLDMETRHLIIDKSTDYVDGTMKLKDTKTHADRENTLPAFVIDIARVWKREQMEQCLMLGEKWMGYHGKDFDKNFIFTQKNGKQMHICSPIKKYYRMIELYNTYVVENEADKIPTDVPPHGLRHSAAAVMIANNMDARTVAGVIGHADPSTTLNIYSYFFSKKGEEAAAVMESVLLPENLKTVVK